eukprot:3846-Heterococcus_DN1.PRE.1
MDSSTEPILMIARSTGKHSSGGSSSASSLKTRSAFISDCMRSSAAMPRSSKAETSSSCGSAAVVDAQAVELSSSIYAASYAATTQN